jgi:hypothetical protein
MRGVRLVPDIASLIRATISRFLASGDGRAEAVILSEAALVLEPNRVAFAAYRQQDVAMNEEEMVAMARKLAPDALKALARIAKGPKASACYRTRAWKQLERRRVQLQQLAGNPNLQADVRGDVESALWAIPERIISRSRG